ncbi:shikimate dehydrogenase [Microbulbifer flavimaris]|uniref:Shikimate dehydrogenase (NADP(+)) n=1 Tax=Microbulbifer flavimaris TaxID=1781068 RepID=A0ABX4HYP8_9GAMM|nr:MULTISPECIES: shikimate dehydrogenase [Microbulbifer]KUJ83071.1 shikimate dehydrogenase [Microbulbifer sp. ZGT114]PCO05257.1 shikimate dehydrogenase [Microbulbifer flavimaris]
MTDSYAVIGNPVEHSLSPGIHAAFARQTGEDIAYEKITAPRDGFESVARRFFAAGGRGLNVTVPFKLDAYEFADRLTERARAAGAVNTLALQSDGGILGDNTDGAGLVADIRNNLGWPIAGARVLMVGAGGAARGAMLPLLEQGPAQVHIANRTAIRAERLAREFARHGVLSGGGFDNLDSLQGTFDLVINASAASLSGELPPLPGALIGPASHAYDMVYGAQPTPFMSWAAERGAKTADGLGMLVGQAAESFMLWRGVKPETAPVLQELRARLQAQ